MLVMLYLLARDKENEKGRRSASLFDISKGFRTTLCRGTSKVSQKRGFDWQEIEPVIEKVKEELNE